MHRAHMLHGLRCPLCGGLPGCVRGRLRYCRKGVPFVAVPASPHSTVVAQRDSDRFRVAGDSAHRCSDLNNLPTHFHFRFRVHVIFLLITTLAGRWRCRFVVRCITMGCRAWLAMVWHGRCPLRGVAGVAAVAVASVFCPVAKQQRNRPFKNPCLGLLPLQPCYSYFRYTCYT